MRVFLTGATGFIGSRVVPELLKAGHDVLGLTRSDAGAQALQAAGADVHRGTLEDLDSLRAGAAQADAVLHTAFDHDFANFVANCEKDRRVITALGETLKGSDRPLIITSGVGMGALQPGQVATEEVFDTQSHHPRAASEQAGEALLQQGVNVSVVRLPQVHDTQKQGLITPYIAQCLAQGQVAYVGEGGNRWSAAHVGDVARLYALALAHAQPGLRHNAVAEEGVSMRAMAEVIGAGLGLPVVSVRGEAIAAHFGWMAMFADADMIASSAITCARLGWTPTGPTILEDLRAMDYTQVAAHG
ncbi:Nucleoside-diphosphate-sugar epimerase [Pseudoxanthomonas sp. GM95]|uniref:SDR family oxidoreductase n=1 Tax=Pseudoxanthomonas sp. GM95 TaxID=1881043 RepID=UPI0008C7E263|nr:SDR family oxidoreductase [Pseudoxanthomonas sp. GM95]SEL51965.1 Nucleoside-diphosphate-sugar epimerase [Pseudoxanthomonas sp. GM95]